MSESSPQAEVQISRVESNMGSATVMIRVTHEDGRRMEVEMTLENYAFIITGGAGIRGNVLVDRKSKAERKKLT